MFSLVLVLVVVVSSSVVSEDIKDLNMDELIRLAEDVSQIRSDVNEEDVQFFLYTRSVSDVYLNENKIELLNSSKPIKILIHGWLENHRRSWYQKLTQEYLKFGDFNVVQVDWEKAARVSYISSAVDTRTIGQFIAMFLKKMKYPENLIHLIGHSLGSHVAGFTGKVFEGKIARITALDPAGPYFRNIVNENDRLSNTDAKIVDVIHTDGGFYGYEYPIGTLDVYVNGGTRVQPGCLQNFQFDSLGKFIEDSFCSHQRSCYYFIDSINKGKFVCHKCLVWWENYLPGKCNVSNKYVFHAEEITKDMKGVCYVETEPREPFLKNE